MTDGAEGHVGRRRARRRRSRRSLLRHPVVRRALGVALVAAPLLAGAAWIVRPRDARGVASREYHTARLAFAAGDLDTALREARAAVDGWPRSPDARLLLALILHRRGATDEAVALLTEDARRDRDADAARVVLASLALEDDDVAAALRLLHEAVEREPTPPEAWRLLGDVRARTGDADGAAVAYAQAAAGDPDDVHARLALGDVLLARALDTGSEVARERAGSVYAEAESLCRTRLAAGGGALWRPALAKALAGGARALRGASLAAAEKEMRVLVAAAEDDARPTLALAEFLSGVGRESDARRLLEDAERRFSGAAPRRALARVLTALGEDAESVAALRRGVAAAPDDVEAHADLVARLTELGRFEDAAAAVAAAPTDVPGAWRVHEVAGDLARARARAAEAQGAAQRAAAAREDARAAYGRALALRPRSMLLQKKRFGELLEAGAAAPESLSQEERDAARTYLDGVLSVHPRDADALAWRARLLLLDGDDDAAVALLAEPASGEAPPLDLLRLHAIACERTGRAEQAADSHDRVLARLTRRDDARRAPRGAPPAVWGDAVRSALRAGRAELAAAVSEEGSAVWPKDVDLRLLRAEALLASRRDRDALGSLDDARREIPGDVELVLATAFTQERLGRPADAEATLRRALDEEADAAVPAPGRSDLRFALARRLGSAGRLDAMRTELDAARREADDPSTAALREGDVLLALDPPEVDGARAAYALAARTAPDPRPALVRAAEAAFVASRGDAVRSDDVAEAVAACRAAGVVPAVQWYLDGKLALLEGRAADAVRQLELAVGAGARSAAVLYHLARARRAAGGGADADEVLSRAAELRPGDAALRRELALLRADLAATELSAGRPAAALLLLSDVDETAPGVRLLALARAVRTEWDTAELLSRQAVAQAPADPVARHLLAAVLVRSGGTPRLREAASLYATLLRDDAADGCALVGRATALAALGDPEAAAAWDAVAAVRPGDLAVLRQRVAAAIVAGRAAEALDHVHAQRAAAGDPSLDALEGDVLLHLGRHDEAAEAYLRAADADREDVRLLLGAAAALAASGRAGEARDLLQARIVRLADPRPAWLALGDLWARAGDVERALEALARATGGGAPSGYEALLRGEVAEAAGDPAAARAHLAAHATDDDLRPERLRRLAALFAAAGETRRALDAVDGLLALRPDDAAAHNDRALLLAREDGRRADALSAARRARELDATRPEIADTLGWLRVLDGRPSEARALLEEAEAGLPEDARVAFHLGVCLARVGEVAAARERLERALALDAELPGADAARALLDRLR